MKLTALFITALLPLCSFAKTETFSVDKAESKLNWTGKKLTGEHTGTLAIKEGKLKADKGKIVGGSFEVDMTTMTCSDITDKEQNGKLIGHLKSDDFFSVDKHPTAKFEITKIDTNKDGKSTITGNLNIKGISNSISFPAELKVDNTKLSATGTISVDRTKWDIKYRSGRFFPDLGDKVIKDEFNVQVNLTAKK